MFSFTVKSRRREPALRDSPNSAKSGLWKSHGGVICSQLYLKGLQFPLTILKGLCTHMVVKVTFKSTFWNTCVGKKLFYVKRTLELCLWWCLFWQSSCTVPFVCIQMFCIIIVHFRTFIMVDKLVALSFNLGQFCLYFCFCLCFIWSVFLVG